MMFSRSSTSNSNPLAKRNIVWAWVVAATVIIVPFMALNLWVQTTLFSHVSYTNSASFDVSWRNFSARQDWKIIAFGNSEVRWGFDPAAIEQTLGSIGVDGRMFNLGIDGALGDVMIPFLQLEQRAPDLRVAIIGAQLSEYSDLIRLDEFSIQQMRCETALQKPIMTSPFGRDTGLAEMCFGDTFLDKVQYTAESLIPIFKYSEALKGYFLSFVKDPTHFIPLDSGALAHNENGWGPHKSIANHYSNYVQAMDGLKREKESGAPGYAPLDDAYWATSVEPDQHFEQIANWFLERNILPVFVALPTNPLYIDFRERRENYARASEVLTTWADGKGVVFLDLGIQDQLSPTDDYADHRHLSRSGAQIFSAALAKKISENPQIIAALE